MTIRLLSTYDGFSPNDIITIDPALEASFIAAGNATANLAGGVVAYRERQPVMIQPATKKRGGVSLIANRKAIVPLTEGSVLTITPAAGTTGTYQRYDGSGAAVGSSAAIATSVLMAGPFEGDFTVEIKCTTGSLTAKAADAAGTAVQAPMLANGLSVMGDSYAANNWGQALTNFVSTQTSGIIVTADEILGGVFDINQMVAVGGKTAREMLTEQLPQVLARRNRYVYISAGYNDIYGEGTAGVTAAGLLIQILQAIINNGQIPIWHTVGARSYSTAAQVTEHLACNAALRDFAKSNACGVFFDLFAITVDPTTKPGQLAVRSGWTLEGVNHWNLLGGYYGGKALAARLKAIVNLPNQLPSGSEDNTTSPTTNRLANVIFDMTTNGNTGSNIVGPVPSSWSVTWATRTGTAVATVTEIDVLDADTGLPTAKGLKVEITSGATAAGDVISIAQTVSVPVVAGDLFAAETRLTLVSPSFINQAAVRARANGNESTWAGFNIPKSGAGTNPDYPESQTFARRTRKIAALANGTIDTFEARISFSGAATSGAVVLSQPRLRKF